MTISSLLENFRHALAVLAPVAERVGVPWKHPDAYDEWDAITTTLFENLVVSVIRWSLPGDEQKIFRMPAYDLLHVTYAEFSTLEVVHPSLGSGRWLFHAFVTEKDPFDAIEVREVCENGTLLDEAVATCSADGSVFRLRLCQENAPSQVLVELEDLAD